MQTSQAKWAGHDLGKKKRGNSAMVDLIRCQQRRGRCKGPRAALGPHARPTECVACLMVRRVCMRVHPCGLSAARWLAAKMARVVWCGPHRSAWGGQCGWRVAQVYYSGCSMSNFAPSSSPSASLCHMPWHSAAWPHEPPRSLSARSLAWSIENTVSTWRQQRARPSAAKSAPGQPSPGACMYARARPGQAHRERARSSEAARHTRRG